VPLPSVESDSTDGGTSSVPDKANPNRPRRVAPQHLHNSPNTHGLRVWKSCSLTLTPDIRNSHTCVAIQQPTRRMRKPSKSCG